MRIMVKEKVTEGLINCKAVKPTVIKHKNKIKGIRGLRYNNSGGPTKCHAATSTTVLCK